MNSNKKIYKLHAIFLLLILSSGLTGYAQNNGLDFNGIDQEVQIGTLPNFDGVTNSPFTIEAWFNPQQSINKGTVWSISVNSGQSLRLKQVAGGGMALDDVDGDILIANSPSIATGRWHHSAVIYDGVELVLYIDGIEEGSITRSITLDGSGLRVGRGTFDFSNFWEGQIDEIRIWDYAISTEDLFSRLFRSVSDSDVGLLHYYDFDQTTGTILFDVLTVSDGVNINMTDGNWVTSEAIEKQLNTSIGVGVWSNPASWSNGVPTTLDSVVIGANSNITVDLQVGMYDLIIQPISTLTHDGFNILVNGDMSATTASTYFSESTDTVFFAGHDQKIEVIASNIFGRLFLAGSGTKVMNQNSETNGSMFISSGVSLDLEFNSITLSGDASWVNNGEMVFGGTLNFNGTSHGIFNPGEIENIFINSAALFILDSDLSIANTFEINNKGILEMQAFTITAPENWNLSGVDTIQWTLGAKIIINKETSSFDSGVNSEPINTTYPTVEVVEGGQFSAGFNLAIEDNESFIISGGESFADSPILILGENSDFTVTSGFANFNTAEIRMKNNSFIEVIGGAFYLQGGEGASQISGNEPGDEYLFFLSGGDLFIDEAIFSNLKGDGIVLNTGFVQMFNNVSFRESPSTNAYISIVSPVFDDLVISDIEFESGPAFNVQKLAPSGTGNINLVNTRGPFAGPSFENVESGTITWTDFDLYDDFTLDFVGSGTHVLIPGGPAFTGPFTVEAWIKPDDVTSIQSIIGWDLNVGDGQFASFGLSASGVLQTDASDGVMFGGLDDTQAIPVNTWTHVAFTMDAGGIVQFYVNGVPTNSGSPITTITGPPINVYIGATNAASGFFDGEIDEVRIWNDLRTQAEINDNVYNELTGSEANLVHYYNFNEGAGTTLNDIATVAPINGIVTGFDLAGMGGESDWNPVTDKPESKQHALNFNGVSNYVTVAGLPYYNDLTLEAWVFPESNSGTRVIASWDFVGNNNSAYLGTLNGKIVFQSDDGIGGNTVLIAPDSLALNKWHHVVLVKQGTTIEIYLNGQTKIAGVIEDVVGATNFRIGNYESGVNLAHFDGSIDEVRVWNTAVGINVIRDFAITEEFGTHPFIGNFMFYADFNEGIIAGGDNTGFVTLPDITSSGFTGTLETFSLNTFESNYVESEAFDALNVNLVANNLSISRFSNNVPSTADNTDFGVVLEGASVSNQFLIINEGFNPVLISNVEDDFDGFNSSLSTTFIQPFDTVFLTLSFSPASLGEIDSFFSFQFGDFSDNYTIAVSGTGYPDESGPGNALDFTGMGTVNLENGAHYSKSVNDPFTIEAWVKFSDTGTNSIFTNIESSTGGDGYSFRVVNGLVQLLLQADQDVNSSISATSSNSIYDNEWTHVAATYDGSGSEDGIEIYIHGFFETDARDNNAFAGEINDFNRFIPELGVFGLTGQIDEFRMWDRVLTDEEIRDGVFNTVDPSSADLSTYFRMDAGSGSEINDLTGNSGGTLSGVALPTFVFSHVPINNVDTFDGLNEKSALWTGDPDFAQSSVMRMADAGFLNDDGDNVVFANDNLLANLDDVVNTNISNLTSVVDERLERNWYLEVSDSVGTEGGVFEIFFENVPFDSTKTYYLLSANDPTEYEIESYLGYYTESTLIRFFVEADSIKEKGFYTLGRSLEFPGNALAFDGIDDSTTTFTDINHLETFTYETWIKTSAPLGSYSPFLSMKSGISDYVELGVSSTGSFIYQGAGSGGISELTAGTIVINDGEWHHIAVTRNFSNVNIYVDGAIDNSGTTNFSSAGFNGPLKIGIDRDGLTGSAFEIDELRVWDVERTAQEISDNYEGVVTPGNSDLVYYNRFDQLGHNLPDLSVNTAASSLYNFEFDGITSGWVPSSAFEFVEPQNALDFDGIDDFVEVSHDPALNIAESGFTIQAWVNPRDGTAETILSKGNGNGGSSPDVFAFQIIDNRLSLTLSDGTSDESLFSDTEIPLDDWAHVGVVYVSATREVTFYRNGIPDGEGVFNIIPSNNADAFPMQIGRLGHACQCDHFNGQIDELAIFSNALNQTEIQNNSLEVLDPASVDLIVYYGFDQGTPDGDNTSTIILTEGGSLGLNGTLTNFGLNSTNSNFIASTAFDFEPELEIIIDGITYNAGESINYGAVFQGNDVLTQVVIRNSGYDSLDITDINYGSVVSTIFRDLSTPLRLDPFQADTVEFDFTENTIGPLTGVLLFNITSNDPDGNYILNADAVIYPDLPGAGNSLVLNGTTSSASTSNSVGLLNGESFSVEYWAKRNSLDTDDIVFSNGPFSAAGDNELLKIGFNAANEITFSFQNNDLNIAWPNANDDWNHFAFTYDAVTLERKIYVNGLELASESGIPNFIGEGNFYIGSAPIDENFDGEIDELRIWSFAIPQNVVQTHLAREISGDNSDLFIDSLMVYYRFDEGSGTDIYDLVNSETFPSVDLIGINTSFSTSEAYFGDGSLSTYTDNELSTEVVGAPIKVTNITTPENGVHIFLVEDPGATSVSSAILTDINNTTFYGVFAPENTFDVQYALSESNDSIRIVKKESFTQTDWKTRSSIFDTDADSVRAFDQNTGFFTAAKVNFENRSDAGSSFVFSNSSQRIETDVPMLVYNDFTFETWVKVPPSETGQIDFFRQNDGSGAGDAQVIIFATFEGKPYFFIRESSGGASEFIGGDKVINDNEWHHIAYIREGTQLTTYVNGILDVALTTPFTAPIIFPPNSNATIKGSGEVDEMRLWNIALPIEQIRNYQYTNDLAEHPSIAELESYYRFDEANGSDFVLDISGDDVGVFFNIDENTARVVSGAFDTPANTVVSIADSGPGSLREVIELANLTPEMDTIKFDLPGDPADWVISLESGIVITDSIFIDATTQPEWDLESGAVVEIEGLTNLVSIGMEVSADYIELYGLKVNSFQNVGMQLTNDDMSGSKIGTLGKGNIFINNLGVGLLISGPDNTIVTNNLIGVDWNGAEGTNDIGLFIISDGSNTTNNEIGGNTFEEANLIAYNNVGIQINDPGSLGNQIRRNQIFCNTSEGIRLALDGNNNKVAPGITSVVETEVSGTGTDGDEVDIYLATDACNSNQGSSYLGTTTVAAGIWTLSGLTLTELDFVTTTANSAVDGTSTFSERFQFALPPAIPTVVALNTTNLEPIITGTFEEGTSLSVEVGPTIYVLGSDAQLTATTGIWTLNLTGSPISAGTYNVVVRSVKTTVDPTLESVDETTDELIIVGNPLAVDASEINGFDFVANWNPLDGVTNYVLDVSSDNLFSQLVTGFDNGLVVAETSQMVVVSDYASEYFYRVRGIVSTGDTTNYSNIIRVKTITPAATIADSTALVKIYNDLDGDNWTTKTNWLVANQRIETWSGVTVANGRVVALDLADNNLEGGLPTFEGEELSTLTSFILSENKMESMSDLTSISTLAVLNLQNNFLTFEDLEANVSITGMVYSPQRQNLERNRLLVNGGEPVEFTAFIGNGNNQYQWFKDDIALPAETAVTLVIPATGFVDEGLYRAEVTNALLPELTLNTDTTELRVSSLERDSTALISMYNEIDGDTWKGNNDWPNLPLSSWDGVILEGERVTQLDLSNSGLKGIFPSVIEEVLSITAINLSGNTFDSIPDLSALPALETFDISGNQISFDDIIKNLSITAFNYANQSLGDAEVEEIIDRGTNYELSVDVGGVNNTYQWFFNEQAIAGGTNSVYTILDINRQNMGDYRCEIKNAGVADLTISSGTSNILAKAKISGTVRLDENQNFDAGKILILQANEGAYDTIQVKDIEVGGEYLFDVILADYVISVDPSDTETYIPTYHKQEIQWDLAEMIKLFNDTTGIDVNITLKPTPPTDGDGLLAGDIFTDFPDDGRIEARRRVRRVGVALRRRRGQGRQDRIEDDEFELYGYTQTDDDGKFSFNGLPSGLYRIFIEYPGIPIDENAFTEFEINDDGRNNDIDVTAVVFEDKIEISGVRLFVPYDPIEELTVYPNPSNNDDLFIKILANRNYEVRFELIDLRGKTVLSEMLNENSFTGDTKRLNIKDLNAGMYIMRVTIPSQQNQVFKSGKVIIQR